MQLRTTTVLLAGVLAALGARPSGSAAQPLRRNLDAYFIFASRGASLKNLQLDGSCNVGVDCAQPSTNSSCGVLDQENVFFGDGSQEAGDFLRFTKGGASVFQVFRNLGPSLGNAVIRDPGGGPGGANPLSPLPILGDLDANGTPSCRTVNNGCVVDPGDLAAACGFPTPFPPCNGNAPVVVMPNQDCVGAVDGNPGNGVCDLAPGTYGELTVQNDASLVLDGGAYVFCSVTIGKNTTTSEASPATVAVSGDFRVNNGSAIGQTCGSLVVQAAGPGTFSFGRGVTANGRFCAPQRTMSVGHGNDLTGQFAADTVVADSNNVGHCCTPSGTSCSCFDSFSPTTAHVGDTITLTSMCDLTRVTAVTICGLPATIGTKTTGTLTATVPAGAADDCEVAVESGSGVFTATATLTVQ